MRKTAKEIYRILVEEDKIYEIQGQIKFYLGDVDIIVKQRDVVGNIIQEWLQGWLDHKGIEYAPSENTQMPPDFFLNPDDRTRELLEVKAFNRNASPGFDIADFRMYAEEIIDKPYMLDVDYLIFGYDMTEDGYVIIKDLWLKKVWQITRRMEDYAINLQIKDGVIHKIRPAVWYSESATDYKPFECLEDFISAMEETVFKEPKLRDSIASRWLSLFQKNYKDRNGKKLDVPRWKDIENKYDLKAIRKLEKAKEDLQKAESNVKKILDRIAKKEENLMNAKTDKQKQKAEEELIKAKKALTNANEKVTIAEMKVAELS